MAISLVSSASIHVFGGSTQLDLPVTISDTGTVLFVGLMIDSNNPASFPPTAVVWDSSGANSSFTLIAARAGSSGRALAAYRLIDPSSGTHSIQFNGVSFSTLNQRAAVAAAYSGVDSTTPCDTATISADAVLASGGSSGIQSTAIPSEVGDLVLGFVAVNNQDSSVVRVGGVGTLRAFTDGDGNLGACLGEWAGAATVQSTWAWTSTGVDHSQVTFNVNAAGAAATPTLRWAGFRMMGMGRM